MKISYNLKSILIFFLLFQTTWIAFAQNSKEEKYYVNSERKWLAELPIWVPGFRGQLAYGEFNLSSSGTKEEREFNRVNSDAGLEFYFVGRIAVQYDKFWIQADAFSGKVGSAFSYISEAQNNNKEFVNVKVQATIPRFVLGYSVWQLEKENDFKMELIPHIGLRYVSFHLQSDVFDSTNIIDIKPNWFEPIIGLYVPVAYKRFKLELQTDYGTNKTNNSWVLSNRYRYRISKLVDVQLGWNFIRLKHKGNLGNDELESNIRLFGPTAGIGFRF